MRIVATTAFGVEGITAREIKNLGYNNVKTSNGRVEIEGDFNDVARLNMWLRTAERVLIIVGEKSVYSFVELFDFVKSLAWEEFIGVNDEFPVVGKSVQSKLYSVPDCQAITKKAVVERLKAVYNVSWFEENANMFKIEVALLKDVATLSIDTSGLGLHKRGYREAAGIAPIKETLACSMIDLTYWRPDRTLHDPMCGSGTMPIEAALIGRNIAPGLNRKFVFTDWDCVDKNIFKRVKEEAYSLIDYDRELKIIGTDISPKAISLARHHAEMAGVDDCIHFQVMDVKDISSNDSYGTLITNPPYGNRLGEEEDVAKLYREMGQIFTSFSTWSSYIITSYKDFEKAYGKFADKKRKLYNGKIQCFYYQYFGPKPNRHKQAE